MSTGTKGRFRQLVPDVFTTNRQLIVLQSVLAFLLLWTLVGRGFGLTDTISSPWLVALNTHELVTEGEWVVHVVDTFRRTMYGFIVTMVIGTILGIAMGWSSVLESAFKDYVTVGLALPSLFAAVFAAMWFGVSDTTPTVAAALISFPFVAQGVYEGVKNIDADLIAMSRSFGVSRTHVVRHVVVESIMSEWFAGVRYAFAICWKITTLAELVAAETGIGFQIARQMANLSITGVLTWTILFLGIIVIAEYGIFQQIEKRVFAWRQEASIAWA